MHFQVSSLNSLAINANSAKDSSYSPEFKNTEIVGFHHTLLNALHYFIEHPLNVLKLCRDKIFLRIQK